RPRRARRDDRRRVRADGDRRRDLRAQHLVVLDADHDGDAVDPRRPRQLADRALHAQAGARMSAFLLRRVGQNRPIVLAYAGALGLFLATSAFSTGFASANHVRVLLIQASFIGIVALGQSFVILGGGIDLSVPWTLNGVAILMTLFANGHDRPLLWAIPLLIG